ncbi:hypothetical protein K474DRAFT_1601776 [Panus rudis PR-1116 ss-1]|nr:hypothetical protein K474DRAFT_1601776 [Panus rudis PR-1116 ss-1]
MPNSARTARHHDEKDRMLEQENKRARGAISCAECRRLKLKCDKSVPCSSCTRRGCASICPNGSLTTGQGTRFILADTDRLHRKIVQMSDRIRQLEDALALLQSSISREVHPLLRRELLDIKSGLELHAGMSGFQQDSGIDSVNAPSGKNDDSSEPIDSFGTLAVRDDGSAAFYGRSAGTEEDISEPPSPQLGRILEPLPPILARLSSSVPAAPSDIEVSELQELLEQYLPPWPRASQLCDLYLEQAPWFFGALTRRQLLEELLPLFYEEAEPIPSNGHHSQGQSSAVSSGTAFSTSAATFSLPITRSSSKATAHDLALIFVIFCFGALTDPLLPPAPHNTESSRYYEITRAALNLEPVLDRPPSVVTVQTLALMAIYQGLVSDEKSIEATWAYFGLSCRLAQSVNKDPARWKLPPSEVQKRRALFWELFITDGWQSLATGRLSMFSLPFVDTELPADPDQVIAEDGSFQPSFPAWKARFGKECISAVVQGTTLANAPKYSAILELDRKIRDMDIPKYATDPPREGSGLRQTMARFMPFNYRELTLIYVHRVFFAQALLEHPTDPLRSQYAPSFLAGYRSSCALLSSMREQFSLFPVQLARFWVLWTHAFSASVLLGSVVTHGGGTKTAQAALGELRLALELFDRAARYGGRAVKFLPILRRLHDKAYKAFNDGFKMRKDIFTPRDPVQDAQPDELSIFSGKTHTMSRTPESSSNNNSPSAPSAAANTNKNGNNSNPSQAQVPPPSYFHSLETYGGHVHPMLVDELKSFEGQLDEQITTYGSSHHSQYPQGHLHPQHQPQQPSANQSQQQQPHPNHVQQQHFDVVQPQRHVGPTADEGSDAYRHVHHVQYAQQMAAQAHAHGQHNQPPPQQQPQQPPPQQHHLRPGEESIVPSPVDPHAQHQSQPHGSMLFEGPDPRADNQGQVESMPMYGGVDVSEDTFNGGSSSQHYGQTHTYQEYPSHSQPTHDTYNAQNEGAAWAVPQSQPNPNTHLYSQAHAQSQGHPSSTFTSEEMMMYTPSGGVPVPLAQPQPFPHPHTQQVYQDPYQHQNPPNSSSHPHVHSQQSQAQSHPHPHQPRPQPQPQQPHQQQQHHSLHPVLPVHTGSRHSLQDTWMSFMQHELPSAHPSSSSLSANGGVAPNIPTHHHPMNIVATGSMDALPGGVGANMGMSMADVNQYGHQMRRPSLQMQIAVQMR